MLKYRNNEYCRSGFKIWQNSWVDAGWQFYAGPVLFSQWGTGSDCSLVALSPCLVNIYMEPLGEIIRHYGLTYHHCADDTQLHTWCPEWWGHTTFSWCLEVVRTWDWGTTGFNGTLLGKTEWLWGHGTSWSEVLSSFILDRVALPRSDPVCNLGAHLDSHLLLEEQMMAWLGEVLHSSFLHQRWSFLAHDSPALSYSKLSHLFSGLLQCTLHGVILDIHSEVSAGANYGSESNLWGPQDGP